MRPVSGSRRAKPRYSESCFGTFKQKYASFKSSLMPVYFVSGFSCETKLGRSSRRKVSTSKCGERGLPLTRNLIPFSSPGRLSFFSRRKAERTALGQVGEAEMVP